MNTLQLIARTVGEKIALVYTRLKTHTAEKNIHRTSAEIRAEITDADIPPSIARGAETDAKISVHNDAGNAHPGLRNSITNLENGTTAAGRSEYAQKLGDTNASYTKTQLDTCLNGLIRDVTYDSATAKFTFWFLDGRTIEIDTPLENTVRDGRYDTATASLVLVLVSGQEISIPAAGLNKIYTGKDTATATTTVNAAGEIAVALKQGTIDSVHLSSALQTAINSHLTLTGDTRDNIATFADQPTRVNLSSGDKHALLFGKIKRWFSDLGALAFLNKVGKTDMDAALQGEINGKEPVFTKNSAFNKNFGTVTGTVCQGNDARLSDSRPANGGNADSSFFNKINILDNDDSSVPTGNQQFQAFITKGIGAAREGGDGYILAQKYHSQCCSQLYIDADPTYNIALRQSDAVGKWNAWKKLAFLSDIPASLPANGGDADTVDGKHATDFVQTNARNTINGSLTIKDSIYQPLLIYSHAQPNPASVFLGDQNDLVLRLHDHPEAKDTGTDVRINSDKFTWAGKQVATTNQIPTSLPANGGNAHTVDGLHAAAAGVVEGGKLASYDVNSYMHAKIFKDYYQIDDNLAVGFVGFKISQADGYHRFCSLARFKSVLGNMPPSAHSHPKSQITDFPTNIVTTDTAQTISGAKTFTTYCDFRAGGGNSGSDMRFKKEVTPVGNILTDLLNLDVIQYSWDKSGETRRNTFGLSASQLLEKGGVFGKIVHERGDEDATQWVEYDRVGVLTLKGLQEIARKTEDANAILRQELNSLRQEMAALREHVQSLKNMILR